LPIENRGDALTCLAIPVRRQGPADMVCGDRLVELRAQQIPIAADQHVRASRHGDGPFCIRAQGEAWNPEIRRLLLNASGVGEHHGRVFLQSQELDVPDRIDQPHVGIGPAAQALDPLPCSRMA